MHSLPGGRGYAVANIISLCAGLFGAFVAFSLVQPWYVGLPVAIITIWITTGLSGLVWYQLREFLNCSEKSHRIQSGMILSASLPIGLIALLTIPNWNDFEYNGHNSLLALAGSIMMGLLSFIYGAGIVTLLGISVILIRKRLKK